MRYSLLPVILLLVLLPVGISAQDYYSMDEGGNVRQSRRNKGDRWMLKGTPTGQG